MSPQTVRDRILDFVTFCLQQGASAVITFQLLPRLGHYWTFNYKVASFNDLLIQDSKVWDELYVWEHPSKILMKVILMHLWVLRELT